jgi:hypothetical protein
VAETVAELCASLARAFREGQLDRLSSHYLYPLAIYSPVGLWLEANPQETAEMIFRRRAAALRAGMADVRVTVGETTEGVTGRLAVDVAWDFLNAAGQVIDRSELRYYCRRDADGQLRVEMIEFSRLAFAEAGREKDPPPRPN